MFSVVSVFRTRPFSRAAAAALLAACLPLLPLAANGNPERVGDFALLDHTGGFHQLSYYGDQAAAVILVQSNDHVATRRSLPHFKSLRDRYTESDVVFLLLDATPGQDRDAIAAAAEAGAYGAPVLLDDAQLVAEGLAITRVGELIIIDPKTMTLVHRGVLDGDDALPRSVLDALVAGERWTEPVPQLSAAASGDRIDYPARDTHGERVISYADTIAPMLEANCVECHQPGGIAPFAMNSHLMVQGFGPMIKEVVKTRRMPPGQIDQHVSRPVHAVAGLTVEERQQLVHWIDAGAPKDGDVDPLAELTFEATTFTMGEPDLVYTIPAQQIPATGLVDYRYIPLQLGLEEDIWIRAMEFVPGDRQVLHHVIAYVQTPADRGQAGRRDTVGRGESVGGFAPGRVGEDFGDDGGRLLQKGANLLLQMHYTTSGKETVDETKIGIFLHDEAPKYVMKEVVAAQRRFMVPPHEKEHEIVGEELIEKDAYLYAMMPHMHYRGKRMSYTARYPDGAEELLLSVPKYDFNWQFNYQLEEPVFIPAGTTIVVRGAMDNSERNPGNPDPSKPVHFGLQTQHEMFFGFMTMRFLDVVPETGSDVASAGDD